MYKIKLIGELSPELTILGCKVDDIVNATFQKTNQAMFFDVSYCGHVQHCVVYPDNYEIVSDPQQKKVTVPASEYYVQISIGVVYEKTHLISQVFEFLKKHNNTVISDIDAFLLDLRIWCDRNKIEFDSYPERNTYFATDCFMLQLIKVNK